MKRWIAFSLAVAIIGIAVFFVFRAPSGVEIRSPSQERIALYGMIAGVCGAISAVLGVVKELVSLRKEGGRSDG